MRKPRRHLSIEPRFDETSAICGKRGGMRVLLRDIAFKIYLALGFDRVGVLSDHFLERARLARLERRLGMTIRYVRQGSGGVTIQGEPLDFEIHPTSHLKSNTFIECSGGVKIGKHFHTGRGLTIFSSNHNWRSSELIPYDGTDIMKPVKIGDAVWFGANVTLAPGVTIGNGVVASTGSVIFEDIPDCAVVRGNPAQIITYRDKDIFHRLYSEGKFI